MYFILANRNASSGIHVVCSVMTYAYMYQVYAVCTQQRALVFFLLFLIIIIFFYAVQSCARESYPWLNIQLTRTQLQVCSNRRMTSMVMFFFFVLLPCVCQSMETVEPNIKWSCKLWSCYRLSEVVLTCLCRNRCLLYVSHAILEGTAAPVLYTLILVSTYSC